ncbi:MAG: formamidopyrimidine-DNA glycosylase [Gemmatimonadetes bacterium]|nr:MAG: formamidopyrimidine-DNA glycosylase [Gemmatimonadota bacterium]PYO86441.1 MAG: formamidopyrimidine-DNA glycosylase [Gemmatimonadota bacterium]
MPELPDIVIYIEALERRILGRRLIRCRIINPFVLRSAGVQLAELEGRGVLELRRLGKRIVIRFEDDLAAVIHLMIAGRLHWKPPDARLSRRNGLAAFDFAEGSLLLTEAGSKHRASLHLVRGAAAVDALDPRGLELAASTLQQFKDALTRENHTVKRTLTDPKVFSGIGNAYSDEILHAARLSPLALTSRLADEEIAQLFRAVRETLETWTARLREETGDGFPEKVTAFRPAMAVHGRYRLPCPVCAAPVQRIRYAENEVNYCPRCQTGGKLLADRALSRLLKTDWPRSLDEWEERFRP